MRKKNADTVPDLPRKDYSALRREFSAVRRMETQFSQGMKRLQTARTELFHDIAAPECLGGAVYVASAQRAGEIIVLDQVSINTSGDHQEFVDQNLRQRRLIAAGTSVGDTLAAGQSGIYPSKMAPHDCLNVIDTKAARPVVFQFVFPRGVSIDVAKIQAALDKPASRGKSFRDQARSIVEAYGDKLDILMGLKPPEGDINGIIVATDITGSTNIATSFGADIWDEFLHGWNDRAERVAARQGGILISEAGDGMKIGFPPGNETAVNAARILCAEFELYGREFFKAPLQETGLHLRTAIAAGYFTGTVRGRIFDARPDIRYNGFALVQAQTMLDGAPRDRNLLMASPAAARHLDLNGKPLSVPSTFMPEVRELDL